MSYDVTAVVKLNSLVVKTSSSLIRPRPRPKVHRTMAIWNKMYIVYANIYFMS